LDAAEKAAIGNNRALVRHRAAVPGAGNDHQRFALHRQRRGRIECLGQPRGRRRVCGADENEQWLVDRYAGTVASAFGHEPCVDEVQREAGQAVISVALDGTNQRCARAFAAV